MSFSRAWRCARRGASDISHTIDADSLTARLLGAYVRRLRHARGLTLVQLAESTALSQPFLSQLERGLAQPSLASLRKIAVGLGTSPVELLAATEEHPGGVPSIEERHGGDGALSADFARGTARMLADISRPFRPMEYVSDDVEPGECYVHAEDEFLFVIAGAVRVQLDGGERVLAPGDSVYYAGGVAHRWWSDDGREYRLLIVKQGSRAAVR